MILRTLSPASGSKQTSSLRESETARGETKVKPLLLLLLLLLREATAPMSGVRAKEEAKLEEAPRRKAGRQGGGGGGGLLPFTMQEAWGQRAMEAAMPMRRKQLGKGGAGVERGGLVWAAAQVEWEAEAWARARARASGAQNRQPALI